MDAEENQKQVFPRRPQPLEIAARFPHSHRRDEAVEVENQKQVFPLSTATGWLFRPNSERRPGGGASLLLQAHCSIRKCSDKKKYSIFYLSVDLQQPDLFHARSPLSPTARRSGWQRFVYNLG